MHFDWDCLGVIKAGCVAVSSFTGSMMISDAAVLLYWFLLTIRSEYILALGALLTSRWKSASFFLFVAINAAYSDPTE